MLLQNEIFENLLITNKIDYLGIKNASYIQNYDIDITYDINFIVPVGGRKEFLKPLYQSFSDAIKNTKLKISFTVVEMSSKQEQRNFCEKNKINYIFIEKKEHFNKCLCMNMGALFSIKSKSFIFHDLDCLISPDFFIKLEKNIITKNANIIQCFYKRRLIYLNDEITKLIIEEKLKVEDLSVDLEGVDEDPTINPQAPGGSIYINRDLFFEVGGYDPEFFYGYAPEDSFFWDKVEIINGKIESCDNPRIEIFHMNHERKIDNTHYTPMVRLYEKFIDNDFDSKLEIIFVKKNIIREFYSEQNITNKLENLIIDNYFSKLELIKAADYLFKNKDPKVKKVENKEEVKKEEVFPTTTITVRKAGNKSICSCGEIKNNIEYNYCQRCGKLY